MFEKYKLSDHLNLFYLRCDFDGDGKPDYSILMIDKMSKKTALAISLVHSTPCRCLALVARKSMWERKQTAMICQIRLDRRLASIRSRRTNGE